MGEILAAAITFCSKPENFHPQAASPACTELETIVLDWLGESRLQFYAQTLFALQITPETFSDSLRFS